MGLLLPSNISTTDLLKQAGSVGLDVLGLAVAYVKGYIETKRFQARLAAQLKVDKLDLKLQEIQNQLEAFNRKLEELKK